MTLFPNGVCYNRSANIILIALSNNYNTVKVEYENIHGITVWF